MTINITTFEPTLLKEYLTFAQKAWGNFSYQASQNYINWLYANNPLTQSYEDFLLAQSEKGEIVGCIHNLRQQWLVNQKIVEIPALHNLYVLEADRKGVGAILFLEAIKKESAILVPGCNENVAKIYRSMRAQEIDACWYHYILRPIVGRIKYIKEKCIATNIFERKLLIPPQCPDNIRWTINPEDTLIDKLLLSYEASNQDIARQHYDKTQFKWRFFDPIGPQHILIYYESAQGDIDFILVSIGLHRGLRVARIIETSFSSSIFQQLYEATLNLLKYNKVDMLAIFSVDPKLNSALQNLGHKPIRKKPLTFMYDKKKQPANSYRISAAAGDFGFDAIARG